MGAVVNLGKFLGFPTTAIVGKLRRDRWARIEMIEYLT